MHTHMHTQTGSLIADSILTQTGSRTQGRTGAPTRTLTYCVRMVMPSYFLTPPVVEAVRDDYYLPRIVVRDLQFYTFGSLSKWEPRPNAFARA
eukprot:1114491-Pleurochrysis_carterae.AAC.1